MSRVSELEEYCGQELLHQDRRLIRCQSDVSKFEIADLEQNSSNVDIKLLGDNQKSFSQNQSFDLLSKSRTGEIESPFRLNMAQENKGS